MGANSDYPCFFPAEVHFSWSGTLKGKLALPHRAEQTEYFMSLHVTGLLILPMAELPFFPNTMSWAATDVILLVLEIWPHYPVKAGILCSAIAGENGSVIMRSRGEVGRVITGMQEGLSLSNSSYSHHTSLQFCILPLKKYFEVIIILLILFHV